MVRYRAKKDLWLVGIMILPIGIALYVFIFAYYDLISLAAMMLLNVLIVWILVDSYVELEESAVKIKFGPIRQRIHYVDIKSLERVKNLWSSMALSVDRIAIKTKNNAFFTGITYISVKDNDALFETLKSLCPNLQQK